MPIIVLCSEKKIPEADCPCCYRALLERQRMMGELNQLYTLHQRLLSKRERQRVNHKCSVFGCEIEVRSEHPFCVAHWFKVDEAKRNELWRAYKSGDVETWAKLVKEAGNGLR